MAIEQLKVHEIVHQAVSMKVDIPEFQREFVWDPDQVKKLVESLYRDYPVGSFLLWDSSKYQEAKSAQGTQASLWIVDGQQRTTAMCLLLGMKPYWWPDAYDWNKALERYDVMVNLLPGTDGDQLEFALPNPIRRQDPHWIGIRQILKLDDVAGLTPLAQRVAKSISPEPDRMMEVFGVISSRLNRLWQIRERMVPIIKISHEVEDVAEIFARVNQEGTRVKEADVILALAAVRNPGWVRDEYGPVRAGLEDRGWDLDAGVFIRTMTGIGYGRARLIEVPKDFWNPANLPTAWKAANETISEVLKRLAELGILSSDLLPSTNSLIPLFVFFRRWKDQPGFSFGKVLRWFLLANRDGRYSGSAITSLNEDIRAIHEARDCSEALQNLLLQLRVSSILPEEFLYRYDRAGNRFLRLMLYLVLFHRGAKDWVDGTRLGYDKTGGPITTGFEPQWHHIYPRNLLKRSNIPDDEIHALANITVLNERTNANRLAGKEPWRYIKQERISKASLRDHLVPESFAENVNLKQWAISRYRDFVIARANLLSQEVNNFLSSLV